MKLPSWATEAHREILEARQRAGYLYGWLIGDGATAGGTKTGPAADRAAERAAKAAVKGRGRDCRPPVIATVYLGGDDWPVSTSSRATPRPA